MEQRRRGAAAGRACLVISRSFGEYSDSRNFRCGDVVMRREQIATERRVKMVEMKTTH